ncbi:MAG: glyceraldehyde 3-phosphate dehydrogenase NAD-binding domain-containing protein [Rhodocyclaceae bacterium]|nr:glyceraldehyde 3-phosphate dehydrogenase NAD-binding domain-containing protein [Rhodocyclaceae bacterium]
MSLRIAINGYGRIGRCLLRALYESPWREGIEVAAINEPADLDSIAYLTRFDSTHGRFPGRVERAGQCLRIDDAVIPVSHAAAPGDVRWRELGVDLLVECSGRYSYRRELEQFLAAGCPRLLLSHPGHSAADVDRTAVVGINHESLNGADRLVSAASCTTNAIVPVLTLLDEAFAVEHVSMTTLHSAMNDQPLIDGYHHADLRRTRSAMQSMIPVSTGLARGVERLMPALAGRVQAKAIRVPVLNVSAIDLTVTLGRDATAAEINAHMATAADGDFAGLLAFTNEPHASVDFNHHPHSAIVDGSQTRVAGKRQANLLVWFDNEWGFVNRMIELAAFWQSRW